MKKLLLLCMALAVLSFSACKKQVAQTTQTEQVPTTPLKVGVMQGSDQTLPFMIARDRGYFEQEGVNLELIAFSNPQDRDSAEQSGQLDGGTQNILTTALMVAGGFDFKITGLTYGRFGILASPQSGITTLEGLRGKKLGIHTNSMPQYIVNTQLEAAGIPREYELVSIPSLPMRIEMLLDGLIDVTCVPEPMSTMGAARGATLVANVDIAGTDFILFPEKVMNTRLNEVKAFYRAYNRAMQDINANHEATRDYLVEQFGFPPAVRDVYEIIEYPRHPEVPNADQLQSALNWMRAQGLLDADLSPANMIDSRALSEWLN